MNERTARLRQESLDGVPTISSERAELLTAFYRDNIGRWSPPVLRARSFRHLCERQTIWIGAGELIVGERGPRPKVVPTFPELTCHSLEDLRILDSRPLTAYRVGPECLEAYERTVIPFWRGRSLRDRMFALLPPEWHAAYGAGAFTEFMEQRAPGHTVLDDKIYRKGLLDFKDDIASSRAALDWERDPHALDQQEQLVAMEIACDAVILFARRHAELAERMATETGDERRRAELGRIAAVCRRVPGHAPRDFHEALQAYWFCHLAVITELNGWDSFCPGHLDQHLWPFFTRGLADGILSRESARELVECFFVKFNNHPAPPKVGVTAAESGTYTDFANINLGGLLADGSDGSSEVSLLLLDVIDDMHLLQPSSNLQLSRKTPEALSCVTAGASRRCSTLTWWSRSSSARVRRSRMPAPAAARGASRSARSVRRPTSSPATSTW
jgi:formate C-acetyltransferase